MPSDITIRRFNGLVTYSPESDGKVTDLIQCENVQFDQDGMARARHGQHFISNVALGEDQLTYVGNVRFFGGFKIFVSAETWYSWDGSDLTPTLSDLSTKTVTSGSRTAGNVVTLVVPVNHGVIAGNVILVDVADATYDGTFTVTSVTATTIVYTQGGGPGADAASGAGTIKVFPPGGLGTVGVEYSTKIYFGNGVNLSFTGGAPLVPEFGTTPGFPLGGRDVSGMVFHAERLWWISYQDGPARLYFSAPGNPDSWPAANFIDIGDNNWYFATGLISYQNRLYIWTENDMWVLETPGVPTTWVLRRFARIGADAGSPIEHEGILYWSSPLGAFSFTGSGIEKISDPIEDFYKRRQANSIPAQFNITWVAAFRDHIVFNLRELGSVFTIRTFVYQTKLKVWSEWTWSFQNADRNPQSMWAEDDNDFNFKNGLYITWFDSTQHGFLTGIELDADYKVDEIGTRTGTPTVTEQPYSVVIQTKYSDFDDAYNRKRVLDWALEYEGRDVVVEQADERFAIVNQSLLAPNNSRQIAVSAGARLGRVVTLTVPTGHGVSVGDNVVVDLTDATYDGTFTVKSVTATTIIYDQRAADDVSSGSGTITFTPNTVYLNKVRGIGYFRKMGLKITATNFRNVGFKFYGLYARMRVRGRQITNQEQLKR